MEPPPIKWHDWGVTGTGAGVSKVLEGRGRLAINTGNMRRNGCVRYEVDASVDGR